MDRDGRGIIQKKGVPDPTPLELGSPDHGSDSGDEMRSDQEGHSGHNEKRPDSGCVCKVEPTGIPDGLDVECDIKEGLNMTLRSQTMVLVSF